MDEYVVDAHAVIWHLFARQRLGASAKAIFDDAQTGKVKILIPAVALAEVIMVVEKRRLPGITMQQLEIEYSLMRQSANYEFLPLSPDDIFNSRILAVIPDIFDRLIVSEALRMGVPLISNDTVIRASGVVNVVWD